MLQQENSELTRPKHNSNGSNLNNYYVYGEINKLLIRPVKKSNYQAKSLAS